MAWAVKYRGEFYDNFGKAWKAEIEEDAFAGTVTTLVLSGNPLTFYFDNDSDEYNDPLRESHAEIRVQSTTNFALQDLYSIEDLQFRVSIYEESNLYWRGFLVPRQYSEPYEMPPYEVTISATDGISILRETKFLNSGAYYTGRTYESQMILNILGKIEHTSFYEYVNIYDDQMLQTVDHSPMDQLKIDPEAFKDTYCGDVLAEILKKYNAAIRHKAGYFHIYRPKELIGNTVYGRYFTGATTKSSVTLTPQQYINRTGYASYRVQTPGGELMVMSPVASVNLRHDYQSRDSWVNNHNFDASTFDGNDFEEWTRGGSSTVSLLSSLIPGETSGAVIDAGYIYQSFGTDALTTPNDVFGIEFDYLLYNGYTSADEDVIVKIRITDDAEVYYLKEDDGETCSWTGVATDISITLDAEVGSSGWLNFKRKFTSLPVDGPYVVNLYYVTADYSQVRVAFKNIRFYTSSQEITKVVQDISSFKYYFWQKGYWNKPQYRWITDVVFKDIFSKEYESTNSINGRELELDYALGDVIDANIDNIPQQFKGSLAYYPIQFRVDIVHLVGESGTANITCNGLTKLATFDTSTTKTATNFVTDHASAYDAVDVTVTSDGAYITFTAQEEGVEFEGDTTIDNVTGDLTGTVTEDTPARVSQLEATSSWSSRAGSESKTLLQLVADEIAAMYSRPKQLIQMPIQETAQALSIDILGNFQDTVNTYNGAVRVFAMNRGEFDVKNRKWDLDLFEIGTGAIVETEIVKTIKYGFLYNWYAVDTGMLAASGWRVPTESDRDTLNTYSGGYFVGGGKLKETGTTYWMNPNTGATNELGFNARGSGQRNGITGAYENITTNNYFWCSTAYIYFRFIYNDVLFLSASTSYPRYGWSVRLVRDATVEEQALADGTACDNYVGNDGQHYNTVKIGTQVWTSENLIETKYSDGSSINYYPSDILWIGTTDGAYCYYENDITNAYTESEQVISTSSSADSTVVTVDSTVITSDSTV